MRQLSLWGKHNPVVARIIIVVSHLLLVCIAAKLAMQFSSSGVQFSSWWLYFFITLFTVTALLYPSKSKGKKSQSHYIKQKSCDFVAALCGFCLVCCFVNQLDKYSFGQTANAYIIHNHSPYKNADAAKLLNDFRNGERKIFSGKEKRIIKNEFRYQLKQYVIAKVSGDKEKGNATALIILACIAAVGLIGIILSLACSLSCSGSDAAAVIVGVLGTAGVIWGLIAVIKSINRKHRKPVETSDKK